MFFSYRRNQSPLRAHAIHHEPTNVNYEKVNNHLKTEEGDDAPAEVRGAGRETQRAKGRRGGTHSSLFSGGLRRLFLFASGTWNRQKRLPSPSSNRK